MITPREQAVFQLNNFSDSPSEFYCDRVLSTNNAIHVLYMTCDLYEKRISELESRINELESIALEEGEYDE